MLRYYMTPETRQAVIAESNRLIANRAALNASRKRTGRDHDPEATEGEAAVDASGEDVASGVESAFARLVADLQSRTATLDS